jgi:hypothetical protein
LQREEGYYSGNGEAVAAEDWVVTEEVTYDAKEDFVRAALANWTSYSAIRHLPYRSAVEADSTDWAAAVEAVAEHGLAKPEFEESEMQDYLAEM